MVKIFSLLLLLSPMIFVANHKVSYRYSIYTNFECDDNCLNGRSIMTVNGFAVRCGCGAQPEMIAIYHGTVEGFCIKHMPYPYVDLSEILAEGK